MKTEGVTGEVDTVYGLVSIACYLNISIGHLHQLIKRGVLDIPRESHGTRIYYLKKDNQEVVRSLREHQKKKTVRPACSSRDIPSISGTFIDFVQK